MCQRCSHRSLAHLSEPETGPGNTRGIQLHLGVIETLLGDTRRSASESLELRDRNLSDKVHTRLHRTRSGIFREYRRGTGFAPSCFENILVGKASKTYCSQAKASRFLLCNVDKWNFRDLRRQFLGCMDSRRLAQVKDS